MKMISKVYLGNSARKALRIEAPTEPDAFLVTIHVTIGRIVQTNLTEAVYRLNHGRPCTPSRIQGDNTLFAVLTLKNALQNEDVSPK